MKTSNNLLIAGLALLSLASCENEQENKNTPVPIKLGANVIRTKAPVDAVADFVSNIGIFGIRSDAWTATPWINNDQSAVGVGGSITLSTPYFYPAEGDSIYFYAYHPFAATGTSGANYVSAPAIGTPPVLNFTLTGQEDIMYATSVFGAKATTVSGALNFNHALTQLKFTAKTGVTFPSLVTVTSITFKGVNTKGSMDISNGTLSAWGTPSSAITSTILNSGAISTTATASNVGGAVMLQPGQASFLVDIVTSFGTFSNITISPTGSDTEFEAGKAYTVELTFTSTQISLSATVSPWTNTGTGAGSVQ